MRKNNYISKGRELVPPRRQHPDLEIEDTPAVRNKYENAMKAHQESSGPWPGKAYLSCWFVILMEDEWPDYHSACTP